ncbi:MAG: T9SS type A sorting domain-containing protein [Bacteroidales bacterium]|nr:T9SS type A sorting domain-containing protein [Bacteroidales bacterium]
MRHYLHVFLVMISASLAGQQIDIARVNQMPDFPQPYEMRDWADVARKYDSLVYDLDLEGTHLPLVEIFDQPINYPGHEAFGLHSYVGTQAPLSGEAINVLPSVIGATLVGIDKRNQFGRNWVLMCEEFFNRASGEGIYLNNPFGETGSDWWYETMPNIFFYQLNKLYPHTGDFDYQFVQVADRWLSAVMAMGGKDTPWEVPEMNYRAWNLKLMEPLDEGVPEPEAAGALAWILYSAYMETGEMKYRVGAEWCMEFLDNLDTNPSYELQLAYGVVTAARMNAELGTNYDIDKMLNWCFDIGPLRNWGAIIGTWGGLDCSGLIGEQSPGGTGYAFNMNGLQQAAALLPLVRYNDHYARALGKWLLNMANASRLYYSDYLDAAHQDGEDWSAAYDPGSVIGYEALKETYSGQSPYATGDAIGGGWSSTNFALYGSSHAGMLGGILEFTGVEGILRVDLLKTDFYKEEAFPSYLYYNPHNVAHQVAVDPGAAPSDIYESTTNQFLAVGQSGPYNLTIPGKSARVVVLVPSGMTVTSRYGKTYAGEVVIDFQNGATVANVPPRIKSLATAEPLVVTNSEKIIYCTAADREGGSLLYSWQGNAGPWTTSSTYLWKAPAVEGDALVSCFVKDEGGLLDSMQLLIHVVQRIKAPPVISSLLAEKRKIHPGTAVTLRCEASDINADTLNYQWSASGGTIEGAGQDVSWIAPLQEGNYYIRCTVTNFDLLTDSDSLEIMVRDSTYAQMGSMVANFPLDGNANDLSRYHNHGLASYVAWESDRFAEPGRSAGLNGENAAVRVVHMEYLNFTGGITVSCWIKSLANKTAEQFIVSHGSWQNRWKISLSNNVLRFTINGSNGIVDLDAGESLETGTWYHVTAIYNGMDMELYINGRLSSFKPWTGTINATLTDLTIGQMIPGNTSYNFKGNLDDLKIYDYGINDQVVQQLYTGTKATDRYAEDFARFTVYPNPAREHITIAFNDKDVSVGSICISGIHGELVWRTDSPEQFRDGDRLVLPLHVPDPGIYFISFKLSEEMYTQKLIIY